MSAKAPVILTVMGESLTRRFEIVSFSMVEPSTMQCRFQTKDGTPLESTGNVISYTGNIDGLPPFSLLLPRAGQPTPSQPT